MQVSKKLPDIQEIINAFESQGLEVELQHFRTACSNPKIGGLTSIRVISSDGKTQLCAGAAQCSASDNFDKAIGTRIAFHRMMKDFFSQL